MKELIEQLMLEGYSKSEAVDILREEQHTKKAYTMASRESMLEAREERKQEYSKAYPYATCATPKY